MLPGMRRLLIVLAACGSSGSSKPTTTPPPASTPAPTTQDVCVAGIDKLGPMLERRFQTKMTPGERDQAIAKCRASDDDARAIIGCFANAADDDAIVACMQGAPSKNGTNPQD